MIQYAERLAGFQFNISQGSYNPGGVGASGGTHDKESVDFSVRGLSDKDRITTVRALKNTGFAAWWRQPDQGPWPEHVHAVPINGDLSPQAAYQIRAWDAKPPRDGLTVNKVDLTYHPPKVTFSWLRRKPVKR